MTTPAQWWHGARPRTLPAAIAPVAAGSGIAAYANEFDPLYAALALVVSLAFQVGVNYANDYSDGIRGTDDRRIGPMRLTASGAASPLAVKRAALFCFAVGAVAGLALVLLSQLWWLLAVGLLSILAAWYYTGGRSPYGYRGLGELSVFLFFGIVATVGTAYVQTNELTALAGIVAIGIGALACALLVVNNLRDIPTDTRSGKRTLAVRLGDARTRALYVSLVAVALVVVAVVAVGWTEWVLVTLIAFIPLLPPVGAVVAKATGPELIPVLVGTGRGQLAYGLLFAAGLTVQASGH